MTLSPTSPFGQFLAAAAAARPSFERHLPKALLAEGPSDLLVWQWLAIPVLIAVALAAGAALGWATRRVLGHLAARTRTRWDDELLARVARPLGALWAIAVFGAFEPSLDLGADASQAVRHVLRATTYLALFWAGFRSLDVAFDAASAAAKRLETGLAGLLPLGRKLSKVVLLALGLVAVLNELGFQVASLLAGLGIGGIALALAAQKTVENLFGSIAIGVDQPFRVGDFVRIDDVVGTVEAIGMRSTRVRTLDRTVVTIPNGKLADTRAETFAVRDRLRLLVNLGLAHDTSVAQLRTVLAQIEEVLRAEPTLWPEGISVRFTEIRDWSLNIEVNAWFRISEWSSFTGVRQELLLRFLEIIEASGARLAYPSAAPVSPTAGGKP